ncbi:unnamed protein product [Rotaria sp. Silwood2]|nr:unnamed protein product [Rotaria sp. Silwood2]CAF2880742.1 unnamed protein product [Rotaria sp. Silwood2]CAF3344724.1 unnamed protein product [Rotaria sp. Silwood2]CAF4081734.1 unnamed protein product [Rotaria sp. Silwood2]CAF4283081.1 unnamed protein product [Rotaria sp. Silwood2]
MTQFSDTTTSLDSHILYSLNEDFSSNEADDDNFSIDDKDNYDIETDSEIDGQMETDSKEEDSDDSSDGMDTDSSQMDLDSATSKLNSNEINWSRNAKLEANLTVFDEERSLKDNVKMPKYATPFDYFSLFLTNDIVNYIIEQ